jgi:hypothetical protein
MILALVTLLSNCDIPEVVSVALGRLIQCSEKTLQKLALDEVKLYPMLALLQTEIEFESFT